MKRPAADRKRVRALAVDLPPTEARTVSHSFSFVGNPDGARAVAAEFRRRAAFTRVWVGEESTGDGYWHVVGWRTQSMTDRDVANTSRWMVGLAREHGGEYEGWSQLSQSHVRRHS